MLEDIAGGFTSEEKKRIAQAAGLEDGHTYSDEDIMNLILGMDVKSGGRGLSGISQILYESGSEKDLVLREKLSNQRRQLFDKTIQVTIGDKEVNMSLTTAIATAEALDIKNEVTSRANEMTGLFSDLSTLEMTPEIERSIQAIALNDVMTGKDSKFASKYRIKELTFLQDAKQKFDLSAELEASLSAGIIEGSGALADAIDFNKQFLTMDESIRKAGNELAELQYYLTATETQKALKSAMIEGEDVVPSLRVTAV